MSKLRICLLIIIVSVICYMNAETTITQPSNLNDANAGTEENPIIIDNLGNLRWLSVSELYWGSEELKYFFVQTSDIDASETEQWNNGLGFKPIGNIFIDEIDGEELTEHRYFFSDYDGDYHTISNLYINIDPSVNVACSLFGDIKSSNIKNLTLTNILVNGENAEFSAGMVGMAFSSSNIMNCFVNGTILSSTTSGGLVGLIRDSNIATSGCKISISGNSTNIGGLVGHSSNNVIANCYTINTIETYSSNSFGGLISFSINNNISNCYTATTYSGVFYNIGALLGTAMNSNIDSCLWNQSTSGLSQAIASNTDSSINNTNGYSTEQMNSQSTFENLGWDFSTIWSMNETENNTYPFLTWEIETTPINDYDIEPLKNIISNYPNPFNPTTNISFSLKDESYVEISIYNLKGQRVTSLVNGRLDSGNHTVVWNGDNVKGESVSSGIYFSKLKTDGEVVSICKMILMK